MSITEEPNPQEIDVSKLSSSLSEELENVRVVSRNCCIYRVSNGLRELNKMAYTPQLISIGPIHHGKPELKVMEDHKRRYLHDFLLVTGISLADYLGLIEEKETRLRGCYAEPVELDSANFVKLVLLDAIFIIMTLLKSAGNFETLVTSDIEHRLVSTNVRDTNEIAYDLMLLENQLPFFILEDIFSLSNTQDRLREVTMITLAQGYLKNISKDIKTDTAAEKKFPSNLEHLLHFLVVCFTETKWESRPKRNKVKTLRANSVKELCQSGVKLMRGSKENMFEVRFSLRDGILKIPPLTVTDKTELLFRNLMAYEQYHGLEPVFADYIMVMDQLVNGLSDFELLVEKKIIENISSGIQHSSALFNRLGTGNFIDGESFLYSKLVDDLNDFYGSTWHKWKATLKQKYFKTPWIIFSVVAAGLILVLTIVQTACSIIQLK